jgi:CHAT domain-containing protein/tetratricopeptide (TPR) repeat protein
MLASLIPLTLWLLLTAPADPRQAPDEIVREAIRAIEGDSAGPMAAQWKTRLDRDSADRDALLALATLARLRYDYPTAERLYQRILAAGSAPDRLAAYARLGLAQGMDAQGFGTRAAEELARARSAANAAGDPVAEGEALLGLSLQRAFSEGIETGLATLDTVEHLVPSSHYEVHAERLRQRGALRGIVGKPDARADATEALVLARRAGSQRLIGQALRSTAQLLQFEGKSDSSIIVLRQAEEAYRRGHDRSQYSTALLWHVNALLAQGDFGGANDLVHLALAEGQAARNLFAVGSAYIALGSITIFLSNYSAASDYLNTSVAMFERLGDHSSAMKARDYLAVTALAAGDLAGARQQTLEVLKWYRKTGESTIEFSALRNLAIIAMHEGNWTAGSQALQEAHALARRMKRPMWSAELNYDDGRLALFRGDLDAAERYFLQYLPTLDSSQHVFRHDARIRMADVYARRGNLPVAAREARQAWNELERWRATITDAELRVMAFQASPTEMSDRDASVVRVLAALAMGGRPAESFELAERRRARELADRLAQSRGLHPGRQAPLPNSSKTVKPVTITASDLAEQIPDDSTAVLEYVTGSLGAPTTIFLVTRQKASGSALRALPLPPADSLSDQIVRFEAMLQNGDQATPLSRILGKALLQPAVDALGPGIRRLVIVPDGPLHRLPFDALELRDGHFAAERYAISLAPSASVLLQLWRRHDLHDSGGRPMNLLAFGDPAFPESGSGSGESDQVRSAVSTAGALPRLRRSAAEARRVASFSPHSVVRLREDASAAYLKHAELTPFRILHFATHSLVDEHSAARTALVLAPGDGETGLVGPDDLAALRLDADLVMLSSCRSGGGVIVNGEGIQGLTAPLVQAGARAVVATRWEVGDRRTVKFVDAFYRHLADGRSVGEALRDTKLDAIRRGTPVREWAAFMAVGDPLVQVPLRAPSRNRFSWLIVAVVTALGATFALLYSRRTRSGRNGETS